MTDPPPRPATDEQRGPAAVRKLGRGVAANLTGAVVSGIAAFGVTVAVTRGLAQADAGVFFAATSIFLIANAVGQLGTQTGLVYFLPRTRALGRPELISRYVRTAVVPVLVTAVAMSALMIGTARPLAAAISSEHADSATMLLRVLGLFLPFIALELVMIAASRGLGTMRAHATVELISRPAVQLVLVAVAAAVGSSTFVGLAWAVPYVPAAVLACVWWRRLSARTVTAETDPDARVAGEFWRYSAPRALTAVAQIGMQRLDIVLVAALSGPVDAAIYAAATRFIVIGQMGTNAISLATQPTMSEALATDDLASAAAMYKTSTAWLMVLTWPIYLTLLIYGETLLRVFGPGYSTGVAVLVLLASSMLLSTGFGMVDMVLSMAGHTTWNLINVLVALAVQLGLDLWLIPEHGLIGAAIGWSASIVVRNVAALTQVWFALRLHPFGTDVLMVAALASGCFVVVSGAVRLTLGHGFVSLLVAGAVGGGLYLAGLWRLRRRLQLAALVKVRRGRAQPSPER